MLQPGGGFSHEIFVSVYGGKLQVLKAKYSSLKGVGDGMRLDYPK